MGTTGRMAGILLGAALLLSACGETFLGRDRDQRIADNRPADLRDRDPRDSRLRDLLTAGDDANTTLNVNRYLWSASLDVLSFMPVAFADPFGGVIQFGSGTPPGSRTAYQATVLIQDPALDARSLTLSMRTRSGAVSRETLRTVENAILTRARQLRIRDAGL